MPVPGFFHAHAPVRMLGANIIKVLGESEIRQALLPLHHDASVLYRTVTNQAIRAGILPDLFGEADFMFVMRMVIGAAGDAGSVAE